MDAMIEAKRGCRMQWQYELGGFDKLPADYQQLLLNHFNHIWDAGVRTATEPWNQTAPMPMAGKLIDWYGIACTQYRPVPVESLSALDRMVFNEAAQAAASQPKKGK